MSQSDYLIYFVTMVFDEAKERRIKILEWKRNACDWCRLSNKNEDLQA